MKVSYVGICGLKGSGKTTFSNFLIKYLETDPKIKVVILPFAEGIKDILSLLVSKLTSLSVDDAKQYFINPDLKEQLIPELNVSARSLMVQFGTDFVRNVNDDMWILYARQRIKDIALKYKSKDIDHLIIFFDDVRFENEHNFIIEQGGRCLFVSKSITDFMDNPWYNLKRWWTNLHKHKSEHGIYHKCQTHKDMIVNDNTIQRLSDIASVKALEIMRGLHE